MDFEAVKCEFDNWLKEFSGKGPNETEKPYDICGKTNGYGCVPAGQYTNKFKRFGCSIYSDSGQIVVEYLKNVDQNEKDIAAERFQKLQDRFKLRGECNATYLTNIVFFYIEEDNIDKTRAVLAEYADLMGWGLEAHKETGDWQCQKNIDEARGIHLPKYLYDTIYAIQDIDYDKAKIDIYSDRLNKTTNDDNEDPEPKLNVIENEIKDLIAVENGVRQIVFTGAPGTGKTYSAKRIARKIAEETGGEITNSKGNKAYYDFVQFHPSYDYTDFVEGLRPVRRIKAEDEDEEGNTTEDKMTFVKLDGIFKKFCRQVAKKNEELGNEKALYFFIIDEINRADLSKVFGELMYCLEKDKRGETIDTQYHNLPAYKVDKEGYATLIKDKEIEGENGETKLVDRFADGFYIPKNVVIIGTMNDIDRSVESMDFALRRRFTWKEFEVTQKMLTNALPSVLKIDNLDDEKQKEVKKLVERLAAKIMELNHVIANDANGANEAEVVTGDQFGLNKQYYISQGQFAPISDPENILDKIHKLIEKADKAKENGDNKKKDKEIDEELKPLRKDAWDKRIKSLLYEYVRGERDAEKFVDSCARAFGVKEE